MQTLRAALLEFHLIANSLFFIYSTFLALCRTIYLASGNFLHVAVILKLSDSETQSSLSRTFTWYFEEAITFNTSYQCRSHSHVCNSHSNVLKARDGVWHWSTAWYVFIFPCFMGWHRLKTACLCPPFCLWSCAFLPCYITGGLQLPQRKVRLALRKHIHIKKEQGVWVKNKGFSRYKSTRN